MRRHVLTLTLLGLVAVAGTVPAVAEVSQPRVVSANPVDWTPHVLDGTVRAITMVGYTAVVAGDFSQVTDAEQEGFILRRRNMFTFDLRTGAIGDFDPFLDGPVYALAPGPGGTVYAGGEFGMAHDRLVRGLVQLDLATGRPVREFGAGIDGGDVRALAAHGRWLYAGGTFSAVNGVPRYGLARLDTRTGAVDTSFRAELDATEMRRIKVEDLALSPDGRRLVAVGGFTHSNGVPRHQLVMLDTAATPVRVADWYTDAYRVPCHSSFETYLRGVDFSPDGSYFVVATTGRLVGPGKMCDTVARFETRGAGQHRPTWVNHTGGDSLYTVAATGSAVYVGGHQRWLNNPRGKDSAGPGAVYRPGIAAVDARTGKALAWNPTRDRGVGVRALTATSRGLLVGSDTELLGNEFHGRLGMFPLS